MATVDEALSGGMLAEYRISSWELRLPKRKLLYAHDFFDSWADVEPRMMDISLGKGARTRHEHLETIFNDFVCAERPAGGDLRRVMPVKDGVFKLHPFGSRIYGFFSGEAEFVAVAGAIAEDTKSDKKLNDKKRNAVLKFVKQNGLETSMFKGEIYEVLGTKTK